MVLDNAFIAVYLMLLLLIKIDRQDTVVILRILTEKFLLNDTIQYFECFSL